MIARFTVYGVAQPQGSKTAVVRNGRAIMLDGRRKEAREAFAGWRTSIATAARDWQAENGGVALLTGALSVSAMFYLPRPASTPRRVVFPTKRPDLDKLFRLAGDAMKGVLIAEDSEIVSISTHKRFAMGDRPPRAEIVVEVLA